MNPGKLNKRLSFPAFTVWGSRLIKTKRRDDEQNEELYDFIIRERADITEYLTFTCDNTSYIILTVEEYQKEKGYLLLRCEKSKIHTFYDTCKVSRMVEFEAPNGANREELSVIYPELPCELIRLTSATVNDSEQEQEVVQRYELFVENAHVLKIGDQLEIKHKLDTYKATVQNFFRTHTHQIVELLMESEA